MTCRIMAFLASQPSSISQNIACFLIILLPISFFAGKAVIDVNMILLGLVMLVHSATHRDWHWVKLPWVMALGIFWFYMVARAGFSEHSEKALTSALIWVRYPLFMIAIYVFLKEQKTLHLFLTSLAASLSFVVFNIVLQYFTGSDLFGNGYSTNIESIRLTAVTGKPNVGLHLAWVALPAMVAAVLAALHCRIHIIWKMILLIAPLILVVATYMTAERMATLSIGFGAGLMMLYFFARGKRIVALLSMVSLILVLLAAYFSSETLRLNVARTVAVISDFENTSYGRIMINGLGIFLENPVFGVGVREYRYHCTEGGFAVEKICNEDGISEFLHPHNIYVEILAELGAVGMCLLLVSVVLMLRHYVKAPRDHYLKAFLIACLLAGLIRLFPLASTPNFYTNWSAAPLWMWMGIALALSHHRISLFKENQQ